MRWLDTLFTSALSDAVAPTIAALTPTVGVSANAMRADAQQAHGVQTGVTLHALASSSAHGFMSMVHEQRAADMPINITESPYFADRTGATDVGAIINTVALLGRPIYCPTGIYKVTTAISYIPTPSPVFGQGMRLYGDGADKTIFLTNVASAAMITLDTTAVSPGFTVQRGARLKGFAIKGSTYHPANARGISLRHCYATEIDDVLVDTITGEGLYIPCTEGDTDGCVNTSVRNTTFNACAKWGINVDCGTGHNEVSYLLLDHVTISSCGTADASVATTAPVTGAMRWRGQGLVIHNLGISTSLEVGLYIYGGAGLANCVSADVLTIENATKRDFFCDGLAGAHFRNMQLYNNASHISTQGIWLDATTSLIRNVKFSGTVIRATAENSGYTAFDGTGNNLTYVVVEGTEWNNFDYTGQTRFGAGLINSQYPEIVDEGLRHPFADKSATGSATAAIASSTAVNPSVITTSTAHGYVTGDSVVIASHLVNTSVNGTWSVTVLSATTFSVPVLGNGIGVATGTTTGTLTGTVILNAAVPNYATNPLRNGLYRIRVGSTGAHTVTIPSGNGAAQRGKRFAIEVVNASGGAIAMTFSGMTVLDYVDPANGANTTAQFEYNNADGYRQISLWVNSTGAITGVPHLDLAGTVASAGAFRIPKSTAGVVSRNAAGSADIQHSLTDGSDNVFIGDSTANDVYLRCGSGKLIRFNAGGTDVGAFYSNGGGLLIDGLGTPAKISGTVSTIKGSTSVNLAYTTVNRFVCDVNGIGFYGVTPVAQASRVGQLTDSSTGTPGTTIADAGAAFSQATLNNIHSSLLTKINALELAVHNLGLTA